MTIIIIVFNSSYTSTSPTEPTHPKDQARKEAKDRRHCHKANHKPIAKPWTLPIDGLPACGICLPSRVRGRVTRASKPRGQRCGHSLEEDDAAEQIEANDQEGADQKAGKRPPQYLIREQVGYVYLG